MEKVVERMQHLHVAGKVSSAKVQGSSRILSDDVDSNAALESVIARMEHPERVRSVIARLDNALRCIPEAQILAFGSSVNGFGDSTSDIDLALAASKAHLKEGLNLGKISNKDVAPRTLAHMQSHLRKAGITIVEKVLHARVPILKLKVQGIDCDLSINNLLPLFNTCLLRSYALLSPVTVPLTQEVKKWAKDWGIHGAADGNLSSYSFGLLVIFYMQVRGVLPCLQQHASEEPAWYTEGQDTWNVAMDVIEKRVSNSALAQPSFADFSLFYSKEFQWGKDVASVRTGKLETVSSYPNLKLKRDCSDMLHIEDPFKTERNLNCVLQPKSNRALWNALCAAVDDEPEETSSLQHEATAISTKGNRKAAVKGETKSKDTRGKNSAPSEWTFDPKSSGATEVDFATQVSGAKTSGRNKIPKAAEPMVWRPMEEANPQPPPPAERRWRGSGGSEWNASSTQSGSQQHLERSSQSARKPGSLNPAVSALFEKANKAADNRPDSRRGWSCEICSGTRDLQRDADQTDVCYCKKCWDEWEQDVGVHPNYRLGSGLTTSQNGGYHDRLRSQNTHAPMQGALIRQGAVMESFQ